VATKVRASSRLSLTKSPAVRATSALRAGAAGSYSSHAAADNAPGSAATAIAAAVAQRIVRQRRMLPLPRKKIAINGFRGKESRGMRRRAGYG
jgi:hypothetical protein